jgi:transposase
MSNNGTPLPEKLRRQLRRLVEGKSGREAARLLQVSETTVAKALAGLPIAQTTATHLQTKMEEGGQAVAK